MATVIASNLVRVQIKIEIVNFKSLFTGKIYLLMFSICLFKRQKAQIRNFADKNLLRQETHEYNNCFKLNSRASTK